MAIPKGHAANFDTLKKAFAQNDVALVETIRKKDGEPCFLICAVERHGDDTEFKPFAVMFDKNPYDEFMNPLEALEQAEAAKLRRKRRQLKVVK